MYERSIGLRNGSRSPMPCVRLSCRKNGWSNWSGLISSQTFSSLLYRLKNPGCSLASFTTSANGFCWLATAAAAAGGAGVGGGVWGGGECAEGRAAPGASAGVGAAPADGAALAEAAVVAAVAAAAAAATVATSGAGRVAHPNPNADAIAATSIGTRCGDNEDIESALLEDVYRYGHPLLPASAKAFKLLPTPHATNVPVPR